MAYFRIWYIFRYVEVFYIGDIKINPGLINILFTLMLVNDIFLNECLVYILLNSTYLTPV